MAEYDDSPAIGEDADLIAKLQRWDADLEKHWGDWVEEAKECYRFVAGHQYAKDELDKLRSQNKPTAVFNRIGPIIDAVVGAEIAGRQEIKFYPREVGDSGVNEMLSRGAEWIRDQGEAESEESVAFRDTFICGCGWIETVLSYDDDPNGEVIFNRLEPWDVLADPASTKPNFTDARYIRRQKTYSKEEFKELWPGETGVFDDEAELASYTSDPRRAYERDEDERSNRADQVTVSMYQWYETETVVLIPSPDGLDLIPVPYEEYEMMEDAPEGQTVRRKRYRYAMTTGHRLLEQGELEQRKFTIKGITGKRDEEKGTYYGLVRSMKDPQVWANSFFNMILHIIRTNAKGGLVVEEGAVEDIREFEKSWARSDSITKVSPGALQQGRIQPKSGPPYPQAIERLLERAVEAIREVSGVNAEILGLADREQPGVLEQQRKQAVYGILAPFFESFRRYRKQQGELLLDYMRRMQGQLVRVTTGTGVERYVPLIMDQNVTKFDVIVDEAPAGPNQKMQTFQVIQAMLPILRDAELPMDVWVELLRFSPLPESLVAKVSESLMRGEQQGGGDPQAQQIAQVMQNLQMRGAAAEVAKVEADANLKNVEAFSKEVEARNMAARPDPQPQSIL